MLAMLQLAWILISVAVNGIDAAVTRNDGDVDISEHPYLVSIRKNGRHVCSGAILDEHHVITSDRCVPPFRHTWNLMNDLTVVYGTNSLKPSGQRIFVREMFSQNQEINPLNNPVSSSLGVIKFTQPFRFGEDVQPIPLSETEVPLGAKLKMVGWMMTDGQGRTTASLKRATLKRIEVKECQSFYDKEITRSEFCTRPESDYCQGDKGSPLIYEGKLVGVATYGISCDDTTIPDIHPNINKHLEYLKQILKE